MKKLTFLFLLGVSSFFLLGCSSSQSSEKTQRPLVRDQLSEEEISFLLRAGVSIPHMGDVKGVAIGENYAYLYLQEEGRSFQLFAKTKNGSWVSLYNGESEGISYDKLDYFQIPYEPICSTMQCFWVPEKEKEFFLYQVILWQSEDGSWEEVITWDIWKQTLRYRKNRDQRYEIATFKL